MCRSTRRYRPQPPVSSTPMCDIVFNYKGNWQSQAEEGRVDLGSLAGTSRGPAMWPDWFTTDNSVVDTELGVLKADEEADVFRSSDRRHWMTESSYWRPSIPATVAIAPSTAMRKSVETRKLSKKGGCDAHAMAKGTCTRQGARYRDMVVDRRGDATAVPLRLDFQCSIRYRYRWYRDFDGVYLRILR